MYTDSNQKLVGQTTLVQYRMPSEQESMERTRLMASKVGDNGYVNMKTSMWKIFDHIHKWGCIDLW